MNKTLKEKLKELDQLRPLISILLNKKKSAVQVTKRLSYGISSVT